MESITINVPEEIEFQEQRLGVYALLGRIFKKEVSEELLQSLRNDGVLNIDESASHSADPNLFAMAEGEQMMRAYLSDQKTSKLDLDRDYAKTFCGAGSTNYSSAYPFESFFTSEDRLLMQEARDDVVKWYARYGLGKAESWKDCEDHLGVELEFMSLLIQKTIDALKKRDLLQAQELVDDQRKFIDSHLANWIPAFSSSTQAISSTDFYRGAALALCGYVARDSKLL